MSTATALVTFSARDAKTRFGEMLDEALGHPVGITRHDRLTAYVVSKREYEALVAKVQELEDQLWLLSAEDARKEGFASPEEVGDVQRKLGNLDDEPKDDQTGA